MKRLKNWTRRDILKAAGLSSLGVFGASQMPELVFGAEDIPKRIVFLTTPLGSRIKQWRPKNTANHSVLSANNLGPILAPLAAHVSNLTLVDGLDLGPPYMAGLPDGIKNTSVKFWGHSGRSCLWTGYRLSDVSTGGPPNHAYGLSLGASIDQHIAASWQSTPQIIAMGDAGRTLNAPHIAFYEGKDTPIKGDIDPIRVYQKFWGTTMNGSDSEIERRLRARRRILTKSNSDIARILDQIPAAEKDRFQAHQEALARLRGELGQKGASTCQVSPPSNFGDTKASRAKSSLVRTWFDMVFRMLDCDVKRVVGLTFAKDGTNSFSNLSDFLPGVNLANEGLDNVSLHDISHRSKQPGGEQRVMVAFNTFFSQQLALFADDLKSTQYPDGSTLLDHTLIVWGMPMSEGATHSSRNIPFVLLGGRRLGFDVGKYHNFGNWNPSSRNLYGAHGGKPHNHLLTTILHSAGMNNVQQVGDSRIPMGDLDGDLLV